MTGEVTAFLRGQVLRLSPGRRVVTIGLRPVGRRRSFAGQYVAPTESLAPVLLAEPGHRQVGRVVAVNPTSAGAELDMVIGDNSTWLALADGSARVDAQVAFNSSAGDPVDGRPLRVEIT